MDFMYFEFFLVVSALDIYCDTSNDDRPYILNGQSALVQLQQLINQESLLRLTLDKQVQELRVLLYELQGIYNDDLKDQVKSLTEKTKLIDNMDSTIRNLTVESIENYLSIKGMVVSALDIYCDTSNDDRPYILNGQSALVQLQQLINQESLLRLTLDKQVQELRVLLYELQGIYNDDLKDQVKSLTEKTKLIDNMDSTIRNLTVESIENYLSIKRMGCGGYEIRKKPIYFSVCQNSIVEYHNDNAVVRFNRSLANEGSAYDPSTSTFTPPRDGAFFLSFGYKSDKAKFTELHLTVNGINVIRGTVPGDTKYETAERSIILNLKKNDRVQITVAMKGTKLYGYANLVCFSAFSID